VAIIDLSSYNLCELHELQDDVEREINSRQYQDLQKAREQILAIAQEVSVSVQELLAAVDERTKLGTGKRKKLEARCQNPGNSNQT